MTRILKLRKNILSSSQEGVTSLQQENDKIRVSPVGAETLDARPQMFGLPHFASNYCFLSFSTAISAWALATKLAGLTQLRGSRAHLQRILRWASQS